MKAYRYSTIDELSKRIRKQEVSPIDVVDACLKRIEDLNPKLNALITVLADRAREQGTRADKEIRAGDWRGALHGIPVGIKDFYDTAGIKTTAAFERFKDRVPARDAAGVAKLKDAGAVIIGKTNMHELGMGTTSLVSHYGPVHNPWNVDYIAGGSSGGSAAAVASGMCYAALDTDAIGSCRLPASCCGVVGFKGTYGLIDSKGILEGEKADETIMWLGHPGITTRSVEDTTLVLGVLAEINFRAVLDDKKKFRIGVVNNLKADKEVMSAFEKTLDTLCELDHPIRHAPAPFDKASFDVRNIEADRKAVTGQFFTAVDVLVLPTTTTATPAAKIASANPLALSSDNTFFANYYGLPAISVPCGFDSNGLPLGLQIVGKPRGEDVVLRLACQYQKATQWSTKHPAL
jgi:aspartyl-tRNA(Asn)/glutamyl-tRNA(Gln) amidotransferase subunit A